ncbi:MAG TPA: glyoxylate/hydroxypyruvate reductase A [Rhizomicrobium sp.]|jgi:glyoxylate/hydroxypyruvate reductase A|nr:glyoxylate/hydroxypyruvate reductase A [Rhizomicrobium sp.]
MSTLLLVVPPSWLQVWTRPLAEIAQHLTVCAHGRDEYDADDIDYVLTFRPTHGILKSLPNLKVTFSLGAGVDGILDDPEYPAHVPLVRFVDRTLSREMAQYCVMHVLIHYRMQRVFDQAQAERKWRQALLPKRAEDTRIGILGLGEIGTLTAEGLRDLHFSVAGWSRTPRQVPGVESFAGKDELHAFLARSDILICLLPLTPETRGILNADLFAQLPQGAFVINVARGDHLVEADLIAALDSGHLSGATLDVFHTEPLPEESPLWSHPRITVTPHIAAISEPRVAAQYVADRIARFERGEPLDNIVDPERGY